METYNNRATFLVCFNRFNTVPDYQFLENMLPIVKIPFLSVFKSPLCRHSHKSPEEREREQFPEHHKQGCISPHRVP